MSKDREVLVIGLGIMGAPMAKNIAKAGFKVLIWNRTTSVARDLACDNMTAVDRLSDMSKAVRDVIVMVSNADAADAVLFGDDGVAQTLAPASCVLMMSSIPVETAKSQAETLQALNVDYIDAPVSGGQRGAEEASLTIMAGGKQNVVSARENLFASMGKVTYIGDTGAGQLAKLANQLIVGITIGAVAEALIMAEAGGANPAAVRAALLGGFADSTILRQHGERMIVKNFEPGAFCHTQLKDVSTAKELARKLNLYTPYLDMTVELYTEICDTPLRELDHSALYLHLKAPTDVDA